jgi:signal transduction histidine kinase
MRAIQQFKDSLRENQRLQVEVAANQRREHEARMELENHRKIEAAQTARAEELRVSLEKAQAASQAKSDFLSSMSHEFRTPLNAILGFGQLLEIDPHEPLSENQQLAITQILINGEHLFASINDLLYFAQLGDETSPIDVEPVNISDVLETSMPAASPKPDANGVRVNLVSVEPRNLWVKGEPEQLKRCVAHLVSNAVKFNRRNGTVTVDVVDGPENRVRIRVTDTGIGISTTQRDNVFDPFSRLGVENSNIKGFGLGLATSKRLLEMMGGGIDFESTPDEGSCFWIDLDRDTTNRDDTSPIQSPE